MPEGLNASGCWLGQLVGVGWPVGTRLRPPLARVPGHTLAHHPVGQRPEGSTWPSPFQAQVGQTRMECGQHHGVPFLTSLGSSCVAWGPLRSGTESGHRDLRAVCTGWPARGAALQAGVFIVGVRAATRRGWQVGCRVRDGDSARLGPGRTVGELLGGAGPLSLGAAGDGCWQGDLILERGGAW